MIMELFRVEVNALLAKTPTRRFVPAFRKKMFEKLVLKSILPFIETNIPKYGFRTAILLYRSSR